MNESIYYDSLVMVTVVLDPSIYSLGGHISVSHLNIITIYWKSQNTLACKHTPFLLELLFWMVSTDILGNVNLPVSLVLAVEWAASKTHSQDGISGAPPVSSPTRGVETPGPLGSPGVVWGFGEMALGTPERLLWCAGVIVRLDLKKIVTSLHPAALESYQAGFSPNVQS